MSKINIEVRYPSHQDDARHYDTATPPQALPRGEDHGSR